MSDNQNELEPTKKERLATRKKWIPITKQELEKPCGAADDIWTNQEIVEHLQTIYFLDEDLRITEKGMEFLKQRFKKMQRAETIMLERFFIERFNIDIDIDYSID